MKNGRSKQIDADWHPFLKDFCFSPSLWGKQNTCGSPHTLLTNIDQIEDWKYECWKYEFGKYECGIANELTSCKILWDINLCALPSSSIGKSNRNILTTTFNRLANKITSCLCYGDQFFSCSDALFSFLFLSFIAVQYVSFHYCARVWDSFSNS